MQNKELIQHAAYAAIERILNEYFREENLYQVPPQNHQWSIQLSELETLTGEFRYWSATVSYTHLTLPTKRIV